MDEISALTMQSMHADMQQLTQISVNLTNSTTPGYKREVSLARPFGDMVEMGMAAPPDDGMLVDLTPSGLRQTSAPMDIAVTGNAFFEVRTAQGPAYTRRGDLHLDNQGHLVTSAGNLVESVSGELVLNGGKLSIDSAGRVSETTASGTRELGQIKLMRYREHAQPRKIDDALFAAASDMTPVDDSEALVRQGYLENSNVSSAHEMVQLMQTMRHFESMQRTTQGYDEMVSSAIKKLGDA